MIMAVKQIRPMSNFLSSVTLQNIEEFYMLEDKEQDKRLSPSPTLFCAPLFLSFIFIIFWIVWTGLMSGSPKSDLTIVQQLQTDGVYQLDDFGYQKQIQYDEAEGFSFHNTLNIGTKLCISCICLYLWSWCAIPFLGRRLSFWSWCAVPFIGRRLSPPSLSYLNNFVIPAIVLMGSGGCSLLIDDTSQHFLPGGDVRITKKMAFGFYEVTENDLLQSFVFDKGPEQSYLRYKGKDTPLTMTGMFQWFTKPEALYSIHMAEVDELPYTELEELCDFIASKLKVECVRK